MWLRRIAPGVLLFWAGMASALDLSLPGNAVLTREISSDAESYAVPVGPFGDGHIPVTVIEGAFVQQGWRIDAQSATSLQMIAPLRDQLTDAGFEVLLDCDAPACGGFDFRYGTRVLPAPDMFVDFFGYRFLSARRQAGDDVEYLTILLSQVGRAGYIQITQVTPQGTPGLTVVGDPALLPEQVRVLPEGSIGEALISRGHVILSDLAFETGSSDLSEGRYASLMALAEFLTANPGYRMALVGHTDSVGGLSGNIALSKRRAESVKNRLISVYGVSADRLDAEGMGYLSPIASNQSQAGREANRRVEAVLLNGE